MFMLTTAIVVQKRLTCLLHLWLRKGYSIDDGNAFIVATYTLVLPYYGIILVHLFYFGLFSPLQSIFFHSVHFVTLVHFGLFFSIQSISVHFGPLQSTLSILDSLSLKLILFLGYLFNFRLKKYSPPNF